MLEELIKQNIQEVEQGTFGGLVVSYRNANSKYAILKNSVTVKVDLISGKSFEIDITDKVFNKKGDLI